MMMTRGSFALVALVLCGWRNSAAAFGFGPIKAMKAKVGPAASALALGIMVGGAGAAPAEASYRMYQASQDDYLKAVKEGTLRVERKPVYEDPKALTADPWSGRKAEIKARQLAKSGVSATDGKAGRYCAGDYFYVSPLYENACDRVGVSKADQRTDTRDEFQSYLR